MAKAPAAEGQSLGPGVTLNDRIIIYPDGPLPHLDGFRVLAYRAEDRTEPGRELVAYACTHGLPVRSRDMESVAGMEAVGWLGLIDSGTVRWPLSSSQVPMVVYQVPGGNRLMHQINQKIRPVQDTDLARRVAQPVANALRELRARGVTHRAVRPTNMFLSAERGGPVILGDCFTTPPGMGQPAVMEPIESGQCRPEGRGEGIFADDLYALGVTMLILYLGQNPAANVDDGAMILAKIERGSFGALLGDHRLSPLMNDAIRGLLHDELDRRWTLDDLDAWIDGTAAKAAVPRPEGRATRSLKFVGRDHYTTRGLAWTLCRNWSSGPTLMRGEELDAWLRRSVDDPDRALHVAAIVRTMNTGPAVAREANEDISVARLLNVLDPLGPIRYKGIAAMPDGLGPCIAMSFLERNDVPLFSEMLRRDIPHYWFETRQDPNWGAEESRISSLRQTVARPNWGHGIERVLYELNPTLACQSPLLKDDNVSRLPHLLPVLDGKVGKVERGTLPVDRHIAAFIARHFSDSVDGQLAMISDDADRDRRILGVVNLYATLQWKLGPKSLPGLATWLGRLADPIIDSYRSRSTRDRLRSQLPSVLERGDLAALNNLLDSQDTRQEDRSAFDEAVARYAETRSEIDDLEVSGAARRDEAVRIGQQAAAVTSTLVAMIAIAILFVVSL
ncbi:MAG: hypothetical protein WD270_03940 [Acetobacterales bacterium]